MFTIDYFIKKFEAIPEHLWCTFSRHGENGTHCAHGWCDLNNEGAFTTQEEKSLCKIAGYLKLGGFGLINNGGHSNYPQPTPKQRILAALYDIKKMQQPEYVDITKSLAVLPVQETIDTKTDDSINEEIPEDYYLKY